MRSFAIIGRPNVGKSTLFNRILGRYRAIVHDTAGVTRDWQEYTCVFQGLSLRLYDTPGIEHHQGPFPEIQPQGLIWVIDGQQGLTSHDMDLAAWIRRQNMPVILVVNKCESERVHDFAMAECSALGMGNPVLISAKHGLGSADLAQAMASCVPDKHDDKEEDVDLAKRISVVIMGRPNVGKSTLVNRFLGFERMKTGPQAGITTDAVVTRGVWNNHVIEIVDTAGLRRRKHTGDMVEKLACKETYRALVFSHVALVMVDVSDGIQKQDLTLVDAAWKEGRALIVVLNKWDTVADPKAFLKDLPPSITRHPVCTVSCLTGQGFTDLLDQVLATYGQWNERLPTGPLNRWLTKQTTANPPPMINGHRIKIKYMTQIKSRPPTFALFGYRVKDLPPSYQRYLTNRMTDAFGFSALRITLHDGENPYDKS
jgi:GTP-binding protein